MSDWEPFMQIPVSEYRELQTALATANARADHLEERRRHAVEGGAESIREANERADSFWEDRRQFARELAQAQQLLTDVVSLLTHRCAACKAGYARTGSETQNHWKTTKHYMTEEQAESLEGHHTYFLDGGFVYCNADLQEWLAKWDALAVGPTAAEIQRDLENWKDSEMGLIPPAGPTAAAE